MQAKFAIVMVLILKVVWDVMVFRPMFVRFMMILLVNSHCFSVSHMTIKRQVSGSWLSMDHAWVSRGIIFLFVFI